MLKPFLVLCLLASLAGAIPLHNGASWQWRLENPNVDTTKFRVAKVTDSGSHDSGTVWTLAIADSLHSTAWDTAKILARRNGTQRWLHACGRLPWDPDPWDGKAFSWSMYGTPTLPLDAVWGIGSVGRWEWTSSSSLAYGYTVKVDGSRVVSGGEGNYTDDWLPREERDSVLGWTRGWFRGFDWVITAKDGQKLSPTSRDTLRRMALPAVGSTWKWEVLSYPKVTWTDTVVVRSVVSWKILERQGDSLGWVRALVRQQTVDSANRTTFDSTLSMRWQPTTGRRLPHSSIGDGFWFDWTDSLSASGAVRSNSSGNGGGSTPDYTDYYGSSMLRMLPSGGLDSFKTVTGSVQPRFITMQQESWLVVRLLEHDGVKVREPSVAVTPKSKSVRLDFADLPALAATSPEASVSWSDVAGRHGVAKLSRFLQEPPASGILHLEVRLPDGQTRSGMVVLRR